MFKRFRLWLALKLTGNQPERLMLLGTTCISKAFLLCDGDYLTWETSGGRKYAAAELTNETSSVAMVRCLECAHVFEGNPDGKCSCPKCGSGDCLLLF